MKKGVEIFISYAHKDKDLLERLETSLKVLQRQELIDVWHGREIVAGKEWEREIKQHLNTAQIILLLISPNFMNSDYCYEKEMKWAMERHDHGEARVIPIILCPTFSWQEAPFGKLQVLPAEARSVTSRSWKDQDEAFYNVAEGISKAIKEFQGLSSLASATSRTRDALPRLDKPFQIASNLTGWISSVAWSPDGKYIASGGSDNVVYIFDSLTGEKVFHHNGHTDVIFALAWSPDSAYIASGSKDKSVQVWDISRREKSRTYLGHAHLLSSTDWILSVAWSPDGTCIASGSTDETVHVWEPTGKCSKIFRGHKHGFLDWRANSWVSWILSVAWSPDSRRIASSTGGYGRAGWWIIDKMPVLDRAYNKEIKVWDAVTGGNVSTYDAHKKSVTALTWSPDGKYVASASRDNEVHVWDSVKPDPKEAFIYRGHDDRVNAVAWSPDGDLIASAGDDMVIRIWNADISGTDRGRDIYIYRGHTNRINTLSWSPDGTRIASAGDDGTIWIWPAS